MEKIIKKDSTTVIKFSDFELNQLPTSTAKSQQCSTFIDDDNRKNNNIKQKLMPYIELMRLNRPQAVLFVAAPALWALGFLSEPGSLPDAVLFTKLMFGSLFTRTAQCVINDLIDRDIDRNVERTKNRPLATKSIPTVEALTILGGLLTASLGVLLSLPTECIPYGFLGAAGIMLYPFSKRYVKIPSMILASVNAVAIPIVYKALSLDISLESAIPMTFAYIAYTLVYEAIYSFQDLKDDTKLKIHSYARYFGHQNAKVSIAAFMLGSVVSLALCGYVTDKGLPFYTSLAIGSLYYMRDLKRLDTKNLAILGNIFKGCINFSLIIFIGLIVDLMFSERKPQLVSEKIV